MDDERLEKILGAVQNRLGISITKDDPLFSLVVLNKEVLKETFQPLEESVSSLKTDIESAISRLDTSGQEHERKFNILAGQALARYEDIEKACSKLDSSFAKAVENQREQLKTLAGELTESAAKQAVAVSVESAISSINSAAEKQAATYRSAFIELAGEVEKTKAAALGSIETAIGALKIAQTAHANAAKKDSKRLIYSGIFISVAAMISITAAMVFSDIIRGGPVATPQMLKNAELGEAFTRSFVYLDPATQQKVNGALTKVTQSQ